MNEENSCRSWARAWSEAMPARKVAEKVQSGLIPVDCIDDGRIPELLPELVRIDAKSAVDELKKRVNSKKSKEEVGNESNPAD